MKSTSWADKANGAVPGIDEASVTAITLSIGTNGQTNVYPVVIWSDLSGEAPGQVRGTGNATIYAGSHSSADGRCVQFEWQESDGQVGPVIIAGVPHDLTSGFLFLVSTRQPPCVIAQVPYNLADFPTDKDALKKLAETDPTIGDFFRKHAGTKPEDKETGEHAEAVPTDAEAGTNGPR
jgi:hypothetical protein